MVSKRAWMGGIAKLVEPGRDAWHMKQDVRKSHTKHTGEPSVLIITDEGNLKSMAITAMIDSCRIGGVIQNKIRGKRNETVNEAFFKNGSELPLFNIQEECLYVEKKLLKKGKGNTKSITIHQLDSGQAYARSDKKRNENRF